MKVLFNKLKKTNKIFLVIFLLTFVLYLINYFIAAYNLLNLAGIETIIRIIVIVLFGIWLFVYLLWNLINLLLKKYVALIITTVITILFTGIFCIGNYYINMLYSGMDNLSESEYVTYTSNLVTLKETKINSKSILGMINSSDDLEGNKLAKELIKDKKLSDNKVEYYSSYYEMIYDLLNKKIDGIFLNSNYMTIFGNESGFEELKNTIIYHSYSKKLKNQDTTIVSSNKKLTEPFSVLLMGVDSEKQGLNANASFNGDTLMLITFNPKTLNATMFSIPRDTFVPIACNNNRYAKINSSAVYGTSCVIDTVEQLTDITIDYYVKINFKGVVDLVNALGGIDVEVEAPDYSVYLNKYNGQICEQDSLRNFDNLICMDSGYQHLDGEQALAYARCRHAYIQSDIARNRHQQQVIEALTKKVASPSNIDKIEELLNAVTNNLATNMSRNQMLSFYEVLKDMIIKSLSNDGFITIEKTYLEYYDLNVKLSANGIYTSAIGHYPDSLNAISNLMKVNLGLQEKELIKTFSFDANEEYVNKITGQGIRTGETLKVMPNFVGLSVSEAEAWANKNNITLEKEFVDNTSSYYNPNITPGFVANQSYAGGLLLQNLESLTIYINNSQPIEEDTNSTQNNEEQIEDLPEVLLPNEN